MLLCDREHPTVTGILSALARLIRCSSQPARNGTDKTCVHPWEGCFIFIHFQRTSFPPFGISRATDLPLDVCNASALRGLYFTKSTWMVLRRNTKQKDTHCWADNVETAERESTCILRASVKCVWNKVSYYWRTESLKYFEFFSILRYSPTEQAEFFPLDRSYQWPDDRNFRLWPTRTSYAAGIFSHLPTIPQRFSKNSKIPRNVKIHRKFSNCETLSTQVSISPVPIWTILFVLSLRSFGQLDWSNTSLSDALLLWSTKLWENRWVNKHLVKQMRILINRLNRTIEIVKMTNWSFLLNILVDTT